MSDQKLKIAVFIDFDNVEIGVKTTLGLQFDIGAVLEAIKERGEVVTKVAYGDWKRSGDYGRAMSNHAVRLVQRVMTPGGDKNGADINLALDALEMAFTHSHINAFVIVGGDSDFITLVEKLKQYDRKVFVVGGRAFTSQVMQKNCTEFIAYENVVPDRRTHTRHDRGERHPRVAGTQNIDVAVPLVKRALKVLADREVTPQLGLLKSTLLQLDSSFSERDYGVSSFRDFADKLAEHGVVTLKHQGRSTLVELIETDGSAPQRPDVEVVASAAPIVRSDEEGPSVAEVVEHEVRPREAAVDAASLGEGVALVRRVLSEVETQPRWPMYPRQFKQFLRAAEASFDERKYGSIAELMRACQKDGILKLERDRQGGLRVFAASGGGPRASVPHGWSILAGGAPVELPPAEESGEGPAIESETGQDAITVPAEVISSSSEIVSIASSAAAGESDDDIGNRLVGGVVDVTRESMNRGFTSPEDVDDNIGNRPPKAKRARKTVAKKPAARRPAARRKKE
jgi:uncharacterized LabA/DUF88 family protein